MRSRAALLAVVVAGCLAVPAPAAPPPTTLSCGQVVTHDVRLAADVECISEPSGTPGLVVGADGITIDLNGHTVRTILGVDKVSAPAILNEGFDGVTVRNGTADSATRGVVLTNASNNRVVGVNAFTYYLGPRGIEISGGSGNAVESSTANDGVFVVDSPGARIAESTVGGLLVIGVGSDNSVVTRNNVLGSSIVVAASSARVVGNGAAGVGVLRGSGNVVAANVVVHGEGDGIHVSSGAANTAVRLNFAAVNADDGIDVEAAGTRIEGNTAIRNGDYGIEAVPGVVAAGNVASGNGNPAQCLNVVCQ